MTNEVIKLSVYAILFDSDKKCLMQKRANSRFANGWWSFPGGHIEPGESTCDAVQRELQEELSIKVMARHCEHRLTLTRKPQVGIRYVNFFYVISEWSGMPIISDGKASEISFFSLIDLPNPVLPYIREALQLIEKKTHFYESEF